MAKIDDMGLVYEEGGGWSRTRWGSKRRFPTKEAFATEIADYEGVVIPLDEIDDCWMRYTIGDEYECGGYVETYCAGRGHSPVWRWMPRHHEEEYQSCAAVWNDALGAYVNPPVGPYSPTFVPAASQGVRE